MKVVCPNCEKSYSINTNLFLDKEHNIKCISCKHQWTEIFIDKLSVENNPSLEEPSAIQKVPLTNAQVLKILREEAEFDKKIMKSSRHNKKQTQKKNDVIDLKQLNKQGITIVYTSHHLNEAEHFCTRVVIIDHGKIIVKGQPKELIASNEKAHNLEDVFIEFTGKELRDHV